MCAFTTNIAVVDLQTVRKLSNVKQAVKQFLSDLIYIAIKELTCYVSEWIEMEI